MKRRQSERVRERQREVTVSRRASERECVQRESVCTERERERERERKLAALLLIT